MTFLALPGAAVLIVCVAGFDLFETVRANKDPVAFFVDANAIENVLRLVAAIAVLGANSFDPDHQLNPALIRMRSIPPPVDSMFLQRT